MPNCNCNNVEVVRPVYIVLFKGDDSNFTGNQTISVTINTQLDLTGCKAHFRFMDFVQDFNEIPADKTLELVFPANKTAAFPLGTANATLTLEDSVGRTRTVDNRIHVLVTNSVPEAYCNHDTQAVTVTVAGVVTWDMIQDKPEIPSVDSTLTQPGEAADSKAVGDSLRSGFTPWEFSGDTQSGVVYTVIESYIPQSWWEYALYADGTLVDGESYETGGQLVVNFQRTNITATRHLITPTKTSQLTNDGAPGGDGTPYATTTQIPSASSATPQKNGTGAAGSSDNYSREDHVHPTDSTRAPIASPTFTGTPKAPTPQAGDNSTNIATTAFVNNHHDSQIVDADGNKIEADGDMTIRDNDLPWSVESDFFGNHTLNNTAVNHWEVIYDDDSNKLELEFKESSYWELSHYWKDGDNWEQNGVYIASGDENATSLSFSNASATRSLTKPDTVAPKSWVQGYAVANDGGVAKAKALTQQEYEAITTPDANTLYVITED